MRRRLSPRLLLLGLASLGYGCEPAREPARPEPPVAPLVIGTSPPGAIAPEAEPVAPDEPIANAASPLAVPARDPRIALSTHRARGPLTAEAQSLVAQLGTAQPQTPTHAVIGRHLADTYSELARVTEGTPVARTAHKAAAKYYGVVVTEDPQSLQRDEAQYYAALEHELAGDKTNARQAYYELIKNFPGSRWIGFAYFAFGEMFFVDAETDPSKYPLAEQAYREVLKYPPAQNVLYVEAHRRLAEINLRLGGAGPIKRP